MSEDKKPFTVSDRRHFTAEGEAREDAPAEASASRPPPAGAEPASPGPATASADADPRPTLDFAGLLLSLGAQASLLMGLGDEEGAGEAPDLQGAQAIITLLEVLRDKTEGRRTEEEERILQGILYELRMAFVSRTRAVSP